MVIFKENTTVKLFKEVEKITKRTFYDSDKHLTGKKLKSVPKRYTGDTSAFEPIEANREHLINTLLPMVLKMAKDRSTTYVSARIEFDDCLSAGMQGAVIATDLYIEKSKVEKQPAKLSTYAYSYITKYINEYIYNNTTTLSHGVTKGREAMGFAVLAGNKTNENTDNGAGEFFETSNDPALQSSIDLRPEKHLVDNLSQKMFRGVSNQEKTTIFMFFGINYERKYDMNEIALHLNTTVFVISQNIQNAFSLIQKNCSNITDKQELIDILLSSDLSSSAYWQKPII